MKKTLITLALIAASFTSFAAYVKDVPQTIIQPNGDTLHCWATGDEYYHRLHDRAGYTIVEDPLTGYFVYATHTSDGELVPTALIPGRDNPAAAGIQPNLMISEKAYLEKQKAWEIPADALHPAHKTEGDITHGTLNNIIVCIRFADEEGFGTTYSTLNNMMNDSSQNSESVWAYYRTASYGNLRVKTHIYPGHTNDTIICYQDSLPRCCYKPYSESNPQGYQNQYSVEFSLIERAIRYINQNYPISSDINLDNNNDGEIDNIIFVLSGSYTGWSDLLWPHKTSLYDRNVTINGKRVYTFNLMLAGSGEDYFNTSTFCHEMFHSMGAPDLYRYYYGGNVTPVGGWDLMASNSKPPQHMGAWMKYTVGHWIDSVPEISRSGRYSLRSIGDAAPAANTCYRIATSDPYQFYLLEYRDRSERFEHTLPSKGLIITRIDTRFDGNAGYNPNYDIYDGQWIFRPGSQGDQMTGNLGGAAFSATNGRTAFSYQTDPYPFLTDGTIDSSFSITHVSDGGEEIFFCLEHPGDCNLPDELNTDSITTSTARLTWHGSNDQYEVRLSSTEDSLNEPTRIFITDSSFLYLDDLQTNTAYDWQVRGICGADTSYALESKRFVTHLCDTQMVDTIGWNERTSIHLPISVTNRFGYSQQLYTAEELSGPMDITEISFYYRSSGEFTKSHTRIYMGNTEKRHFASQLDYILASGMHFVYEGDFYCYNGWITLQLDKPFYYDGENNLVLGVHDNSGVTVSANHQFAEAFCDSNRSLAFYSNTDDPNPYSLANYAGSKQITRSRNYVIFTGCAAEPGRIVPPDTPRVGIEDTDSQQVRIWGAGKQIHVVGAAGLPVRVYNLMGSLIYSNSKATDEESIPVPAHGLYLVRTGAMNAEKVMITR